MITAKQHISRAGGAVNEDRIWLDGRTLAVLDGSTSLIPGPLDALWFTECFLRGLASSPHPMLCDAVNDSIALTRGEYLKHSFAGSPEYLPSAAGIFVRESEETLDILVIGDCTGIFLLKNGVSLTVCDVSVKRRDKAVLDYCAELHEQTGLSIAELVKTANVRSMLISNRKSMNLEGGYRILSPNMSECSARDMIRLPKESVAEMVLFTDGFDILRTSLAEEDVSLDELYERLRSIEADDPDFSVYPRFKPGDDASAVIAAVLPDLPE